MHYLASGKANLVGHLSSLHNVVGLLRDGHGRIPSSRDWSKMARELRRWTPEELEKLHRVLHSGDALTGMELPTRPSTGGGGVLRAHHALSRV